MSLKIGQLTDIRYFINNYPNEAIASTLRNYKDIFPFYRSVYGDGNCFYRSFSFLFLRNCIWTNFAEVFPLVEINCIVPTKEPSWNATVYPKLEEYWNKDLKYIFRETDINIKEKMIEDLFNYESEFDTILIAYFRSLNYCYFMHEK